MKVIFLSFQFSFWDSRPSEPHVPQRILYPFQFSFWDSFMFGIITSKETTCLTFNSLFEIQFRFKIHEWGCPGRLSILFLRFSFWRSTCWRRKFAETFNSLFEILGGVTRAHHRQLERGLHFQFSFWDSPGREHHEPWMGALLSILFLRFPKPLALKQGNPQRRTFNSLFEIQGVNTPTSPIFLCEISFNSLFEIPQPAPGSSCISPRISFNSLFEIRDLLFLSKIVYVKRSFNSLFEIPSIAAVGGDRRRITIFQFSFWDSHPHDTILHCNAHGQLSILFLRFFDSGASFIVVYDLISFQFSFWDSFYKLFPTFPYLYLFLSILFLRFSAGIHNLRPRMKHIFQFSFWDSIL